MVVIDRDAASTTADELEQLAALDPSPDRRSGGPLIVEGRALLAALSIAAGAIHLAMVPSHSAEWRAEGIAFALAGFVQIGLGGLFFSPRWKTALRVSCFANVAFIAAWAVTRVWGPPWGPHSGISESAGFVDITCVVLEAALVVAGIALLAWRPGTYRLRKDTRALFSIVPIGILLVATVAITSPSAANHAHGHSDVAGGAGGAGHTHDGATAAADGHNHGAAAGDGVSAVSDNGLGMLHNGHHETMHYTKLDATTQAKVDHLVELSRQVAAQYPTLGDMRAAGGRNAGPYGPGLGLHVTAPWAGQGLNPDGVTDDEDALHPMIVIYDGLSDDAKVAGFMYYSVAQNKPEGYPGPNDFWHYHTNVCLKMGPNGSEAPLGADRSVTPQQCAAVGGSLMPSTQWMTHVWSVPGYEVPQKDGGIFAEVNPKLKCSDGTYFMMDAKYWPTHPTNFCKSEL